jgi:hypothetical protein
MKNDLHKFWKLLTCICFKFYKWLLKCQTLLKTCFRIADHIWEKIKNTVKIKLTWMIQFGWQKEEEFL